MVSVYLRILVKVILVYFPCFDIVGFPMEALGLTLPLAFQLLSCCGVLYAEGSVVFPNIGYTAFLGLPCVGSYPSFLFWCHF